ncbi:hypothetical protein K1T71_011575 [Dendrolimus kikuchii]|uniref:Uncharacterized protein n=1 Tax=Dendrolimus kikuchii TaxID=765133 RepID=A0ACC1CLK8_9NEOP|nr:hypothetical protein K1T71_011575 [Dendrolimus kikuchii]
MHRTPVRPRAPAKVVLTPPEKVPLPPGLIPVVGPDTVRRERIRNQINRDWSPVTDDVEETVAESPPAKEEARLEVNINKSPLSIGTQLRKKDEREKSTNDAETQIQKGDLEEATPETVRVDPNQTMYGIMNVDDRAFLKAAKRKQKRAEAGYVTPPSDIISPGRTEVIKDRAKELERTSLTPTSPVTSRQHQEVRKKPLTLKFSPPQKKKGQVGPKDPQHPCEFAFERVRNGRVRTARRRGTWSPRGINLANSRPIFALKVSEDAERRGQHADTSTAAVRVITNTCVTPIGPDRVEVYRFERGCGEYLRTAGDAREAVCSRAARRPARAARTALAEVLALAGLLLRAPLASLLLVQRCALEVARDAIGGCVRDVSDYALKPALAATFNAAAHPALVFAANAGHALRAATAPFVGMALDALEPLVRVLGAVRLVEVHVYSPPPPPAHPI